MPFDITRRKVLQTSAAASAVGVLAGCLGNGDDDAEDDPRNLEDGVGMVDIEHGEIEMGGTLHTGLTEDPPNWDPPEIGDTTSNMVSGDMIYEGLLTTDYDGEIHPWLAEDWEEVDVQEVEDEDYEEYMIDAEEAGPDVLIDDPEAEMVLDMAGGEEAVADDLYGMHVTFDIREGVEFHNGEELTAEHFVQSVGRWVGAGRWSVEMQDWYLHMEAEDDHTLHLYSQLPDADLYYNIGRQPFPEEYWDVEPGEVSPLQGNEPIGTGVWQFEEYEDGSYIILSRFDDHWFDAAEYEESHPDDDFELPDDFPDQPAIEELDYEIIPEDPARSAAIQDEIVDHTYGLASDTLVEFEDSDEFRVSAVTSGGYDFFEYPNQVDPWTNPQVCMGVNHMIPRPQIVDTVFDGWATAANLPLSPTSSGLGVHDFDEYSEEVGDHSEYDPERGQQMVEEAFDDDGVEPPVEVTIMTNSDNDDRVQMVGLIAESMDNSGMFDTTVETYEWGRFVEFLTSGELYQDNNIIMVGLSSGWTPDGFARAVAHPDHHGGACCNHTHYENAEVTELIDDARFGTDPVESDDYRRDTYEELWETLLNDPPCSWIQFGSESDVVRDEVVRGWNAYPFNSSKYSQALFNPPSGQITWLEGGG